MSYKDFTLEDLRNKFGVINIVENLFDTIEEIEPSSWLKETLAVNKLLPSKTEKSKSEFIVAPILIDLKKSYPKLFNLYSGEFLNGDKKKGLYGECDFILTRNINSFDIVAPILSVVEAKKNDIDSGIPQCSAQMIAIKIFNERNKERIKTIYGCVTIAEEWKFLKLEDNIITIDIKNYYFNELNKILGIFKLIIDLNKKEI